MIKTSGRFDREMQLSEVFSVQELDRIKRVLALALNCDVEIVGPETACNSGCGRIEILWELEPIAFIESRKATVEQLKGCSEIFLLLFKEAVRYRMASELHIETASADYEALQEKHQELQKSEKQYRELSKKLEEKVAEQAGVCGLWKHTSPQSHIGIGIAGDAQIWRVPTTLRPLFLPALCRKPLVALGLRAFS